MDKVSMISTTNRTELEFPNAPREKKGGLRSDIVWGYFFIGPVCLGLLVFYIAPIFYSMYLSLTSWDGSSVIRFIGLQNFTNLIQDPQFLQSLRITFIYSIGTVPISIVLAIVIAVLLNTKMRARIVYRTIYFLPSVTMTVAIAVVWRWMFNADSGVVNYLLSIIHIHGPQWLTDPNVILFAIMIVSIWGSVGYNMVILLAGLQGIPTTYYEASAIDGAGFVRQFFSLTLPLLSPAIFFVLVTSVISSLQVFDTIYIMIPSNSGGESVLADATRTVVYSIYQNGFQWFKFGYASAQAWILFIIILAITLVQLRLQKKWVHYE